MENGAFESIMENGAFEIFMEIEHLLKEQSKCSIF